MKKFLLLTLFSFSLFFSVSNYTYASISVEGDTKYVPNPDTWVYESVPAWNNNTTTSNKTTTSDSNSTSNSSSSGGKPNCTYEWEWDVWQALDWCLAWSALVDWSNVTVDWSGWFAAKVINWVDNISIYLWVIAVWSIVYWALIMTLSAWEDEKITKAKNIIKWWIFWFIWLISSAAIINLVVNIMYAL